MGTDPRPRGGAKARECIIRPPWRRARPSLRIVTHAPFFDHDAAPAALLPPPHFAYSAEPAEALLARADTLAVLGFGATAPALDDPRYLRVGLEPLGSAGLVEVWRGNGPVRHGRRRQCRSCR